MIISKEKGIPLTNSIFKDYVDLDLYVFFLLGLLFFVNHNLFDFAKL